MTDKTVSAPEMKSEAKPVQKPVLQPAQRTESPQKGNSAIMARGQSGMQMEKPKTDKLSITGIVPMKSDRGSKYDSAMKASNAFRTNVFLTCVYNDETREGAYGIVVDMEISESSTVCVDTRAMNGSTALPELSRLCVSAQKTT